MENPIFENAKPFSKLFFLIFIIFSSLLIVLIFSLLISIPVFGIEFGNLNSFLDIRNPDNLGFMKFMQIMQSISIFIIPPIIAAYIFSKNFREFLFINKKLNFVNILSVVLIIILSIPIINLFAEINSSLKLPQSLLWLENYMKSAEESAKETTELFLNVKTVPGLLLNLFMVALIPAIGEELLFRGILLKLFADWTKNFHVAIIISAFIFSFIHFQFYGFLPRLLMGILFGYFVFWSKNLWLSMIAHFVNNAIGVIVFFIYFGMPEMDKIEKAGVNYGEYTLLPISFLIAGLLIYIFYKNNKKIEINSVEQKS
jgi:membrane protease YdiL (CAAX protease family)